MTTTATLKDWYRQASSDHLAAGLDWYPEADALAAKISGASVGRITHRQACGVIAALSPRCAWPDNKTAALKVCIGYARGDDAYSLRLSGVYPENIAKAYRILADADFSVCAGCRPAGGHRKTCSAALRGPKVSAFFAAISGTAADGAMDVWATRAARIAPGEIASLLADDPRRAGVPGNTAAYNQLARAYRRAAADVGVTPKQFQAVVWLVIRDSWIRSDGRVHGRRVDGPGSLQDLPF